MTEMNWYVVEAVFESAVPNTGANYSPLLKRSWFLVSAKDESTAWRSDAGRWHSRPAGSQRPPHRDEGRFDSKTARKAVTPHRWTTRIKGSTLLRKLVIVPAPLLTLAASRDEPPIVSILMSLILGGGI